MRIEHEILLEGIAPERAWSLLGDTDALNRISRLPRVSVEVKSARRGVTRSLVRSVGFFPPLAWEEGPFEFVRPLWHRVSRTFTRGPLRSFCGGLDQRAEGSGTRVRFFADMEPRSSLLAPLVRRLGLRQMRIAGEAARAALRPDGAPPAAAGARVEAEKLGICMAKARAEFPEEAGAMESLVREGPDSELLRIRPFEVADRWGRNRLRTLRAFLVASRAGAFDLSWDVLCPHCRAPTHRASRLRDLLAENHCGVCDFSYVADFDRIVEATFRVNAAIRAVEPAVFCLGAPARRRGIAFQALLGPGESREIRVPLATGDYLLTRADSAESLPLLVAEGGGTVEAEIVESGVRGESGARAAEGEVRFRLANRLAEPVRVNLAEAGLAADAATAAIVASLQEFRDLFSSEALAPGVSMAVSSVAILFTDLRGSTEMYERGGDAPAFARVRRHFEALTEAVRDEGGAVVKTLGDAVMASFPKPAAGIRAAVRMQERIALLNAEMGGEPLVVKVGLHCGPCIVVGANDRLDYFGTTANVAARLASQCRGGDIVVSDSVAADPEASRFLRGLEAGREEFTAALKGVRSARRLVRIVPR